MGQKIISAIDIRADKVICLIAQELQILSYYLDRPVLKAVD
jgi:hypothetical protein